MEARLLTGVKWWGGAGQSCEEKIRIPFVLHAEVIASPFEVSVKPGQLITKQLIAFSASEESMRGRAKSCSKSYTKSLTAGSPMIA